uniref:Sorting nexin 16 n=1 Tax=Monodelphis domestica TaxID=13616 RepID=A0A5F8G9H2_MONDO
MATPYIPVPIPVGNSSSNFTTNRSQRSSSFGSISTSSNSSKGQPEDSNVGSYKKTTMPDQMDNNSSMCSSPLIRTKFTGIESSIEYSTRPVENEDQSTESVNWEERPSTPTILGYEVMEERAKFTVYKVAFCETLEETNYQLQKELLEKQKEVESLKKLLNEKQLHIDTIENRIMLLSLEHEETLRISREGECIRKIESSAIEADQDSLDEKNRSDKVPKSGWTDCESEKSITEVEVAEEEED